MKRFIGRVAIVTGGGSGIGQATAAAFAGEGARVGVLDIGGVGARQTVDQIRTSGGEAEAWRCDVTIASEVERSISEAHSRWGGIDILFNNAGINPGAPYVDLTEDLWDRVVDTNLKGPWLCAKAVTPFMHPGSTIVNCASVNSVGTVPGAAAYAASKTGVLGLTRAMALDGAPLGIRVNAILPGSTDTPLMWRGVGGSDVTADQITDLKDRWSRGVPLLRVADPADIASLVLFLCSDDASYITGASFVIDGGMLAQLPGVP